MAVTGTPYIALNRSGATHPLQLSGGVPTSRVITCTSPLLIDGVASADLSANRTLSLITSPAGQVPVGVTRLITCTAPLLIAGAASADLSANRTLSMTPFDGTHDGYVVKNPGGVLGYFLRDDGSFQQGTIAGVSSITAGPGIFVSAPTGGVTISGVIVGLANPGIVPAYGSVDPTKFLCATNPPSWAVPGGTGFILLQAGFPGTTQTGHSHISGIAGSGQVFAGGAVNFDGALIMAQGDGTFPGFANTVFGAVTPAYGFSGLRARGTAAAPTSTQNNDRILVLTGFGYVTGTGFHTNIESGVIVAADGNASTTQPTYMDLQAGANANYTQTRWGQRGLLIAAGPLATSDRANSRLDLRGTLGMKGVVKTADFTVDDVTAHYLLDCSSGLVAATLPSASGRDFRMYRFTKIDDTWRRAAVVSSGIDTIAGLQGLFLGRKGESYLVYSDGANWQVLNHNGQGMQSATRAYQAAVGASSVAQVQACAVEIYDAQAIGATFGVKIRGTYSTSGTPTVQFQFQEDGSGNDMGISPNVALANSASDYGFEIDAEWTIVSSAGGAGTAIINKMTFGVAAASGQMTYYTTTALVTNTFPTTGAFGLRLFIQFSASNAGNNIRVRGLSSYVHQFTNPTV